MLDAYERVTTICAYFFDRLESVGCGSLIENKPKKMLPAALPSPGTSHLEEVHAKPPLL